ncbi:MAG TPA: UDP-glucose/GDP-mannose dehydrogenase family protein [Patescibacteria group bacterium]|jgi:UDPglucose 6-dehydrogenase|nr:UDP-glucose/GDP-mannose dehydrogenase family protein [Patescibacteria group bacterium]
MTITFVGHGYVGLVTAAVFADLGNIVWVIGHTQEKIDNLNKGIIPIYEPGLSEIVQRNVKAKRLLFTLDYDQAIKSSSVVFIAVGTPSKATGDADLSVVYEVAEKIGKHLDGYTVVVTKSTVPVGTNKKTRELIERVKPEKATFDLASVPEFLREGQAISDTLRPDRIVIGTDSKKAEDVLIELHEPIDGNYVLTNIETAEMIKYAANAFLSVKISFANAIAFLSELAGADGLKVLEGIGYDKRIGNQFLSPGAGYGGSCFPKDVRALIHISKQNGYRFTMLEATEEVNKQAMEAIVTKAKKLLGGKIDGQTIGILGLSFKPNTDDMRDAPSITIINVLKTLGAKIKAFDPIAIETAKKKITGIEFCKDAYEAAKDAELLIILTEWNEFKQLDLNKIKSVMKNPVILDGRNIYNPTEVKRLGFVYQGVGR